MKKIALTIITFLLFSIAYSQESATQIRAVWLTTNYQLDWPHSRRSAEEQKQQLINQLDSLKKLNFNTILFQVRMQGSVLYCSNMEPMSSFIRTVDFDGKLFDPLAFAVDECHKRDMECHAWMVTYPMGKNTLARNKDMCKLFKGEWYLDPGNPKTNDYLLSIVKELVSRYDIDGIHFDYIRYPERNISFPDKNTFKKFALGENIESWRRENITKFVTQAYQYVKQIKPWVQVSCSPIGIYRSLSGKGDKWSGYESVYQDTYNWLKLGVMDAVYPMMYYEDNNFYPYVKDWLSNANGRIIVPGLGVYKMLPSEQNWDIETVTRQIDFVNASQSKGEAFFRSSMILNNEKGIKDQLLSYYRNPAKLPPMTWINSKAPSVPINFQIYRIDSKHVEIRWNALPEKDVTYTVYSFYPKDSIDTNNLENIVASNLHSCKLILNMDNSSQGKLFAVSASNRCHIESQLGEVAYFLPSLEIKK